MGIVLLPSPPIVIDVSPLFLRIVALVSLKVFHQLFFWYVFFAAPFPQLCFLKSNPKMNSSLDSGTE